MVSLQSAADPRARRLERADGIRAAHEKPQIRICERRHDLPDLPADLHGGRHLRTGGAADDAGAGCLQRGLEREKHRKKPFSA